MGLCAGGVLVIALAAMLTPQVTWFRSGENGTTEAQPVTPPEPEVKAAPGETESVLRLKEPGEAPKGPFTDDDMRRAVDPNYVVEPGTAKVYLPSQTVPPSRSFTLISKQEKPSVLLPRQIAAKVSPSVVLLVMQDVNGQPLAMGSGFVVRDGVIATNLHVIKGAASGYAKLADRNTKYDVRGVVASDPAHDLVLLAVDGLKAVPLVIGDSTHVAAGDAVYAVGNPRGLEGTFSAGIVSSVRKIGEDSLLQITAPISPGNSGGPVVNSKGQVIGVAVATFKGGQNLNFAIPSRYLSRLIPTIKAPVALRKAAEARRGKKEKSILDHMGRKSTDGVVAGDFLWQYPGGYTSPGDGSYSFSLRNKLRESVRDIVCLVIFYNDQGQPIDVDRITVKTIPSGLAKRIESRVPDSVQDLTTTEGSRTPRTKLEFRILYFDLVNPD